MFDQFSVHFIAQFRYFNSFREKLFDLLFPGRIFSTKLESAIDSVMSKPTERTKERQKRPSFTSKKKPLPPFARLETLYQRSPRDTTQPPTNPPPAVPFFPKGCHIDPLASVGFRAPLSLYTLYPPTVFFSQQRALKWWKKTRCQIITDRTTGLLWLEEQRVSLGLAIRVLPVIFWKNVSQGAAVGDVSGRLRDK